MEIQRIGDAAYALGENPLWDPVDGVLYWIDGRAPAIWRWDPADGRFASWGLPGWTVGSMALRTQGGAILARGDGFYLFDFDSGACTPVALPEADDSRVIFNDGKVDRRGRFIAGGADPNFAEPLGALYTLDTDHTCTRFDNGFTCSNGPCWSPDGKTLYVTDSETDTIFAYDYDLDDGVVTNRRVFFDSSNEAGGPDGCTVDAEGNLWSAFFEGSRIIRISPDGRVVGEVAVPMRWVSSVAFGGADLDVLYVTSIGGELNGLRDPSPQAGALYAIHGLGATGIAEPRFAG